MDVWLIRHTEVAVEPGTCYGRSELELKPTFADEVEALRAQLPERFDRILSSPLSRCTRLAESFGAFDTDARLLEYDFGDWEMQAWDDIDQPSLNEWMQDFVNQRPPNGETVVEMQARVDEFLEHLRQQAHERVLVATHSGVIRCVWASLLQMPPAHMFKIHVGYGTALRLTLGDNPELDVIHPGNGG